MKKRFKTYYFDSLESTNDTAKELVNKTDREFVISTYNQIKGKGKGDRVWHTAAGSGLAISFLVKNPNLKIISAYTSIAAIAVTKLLQGYGIESRIKWPNDILISGKKICGILCESSILSGAPSHVVVGIGLNVNQNPTDFPEEIKDISTSMSIVLNKQIDLKEVEQSLVEIFTEVLENFETDPNYYYDELLQKSIIIGKRCRVLENGLCSTVLIHSVEIDNSLIIVDDKGMRRIYSADILEII
ncbi:biotin--[acetyl-CoA-carboxylase] ligase [Microaceticoccus formicicus]|uniref:biotin--[acetyl-CoA-carboxylase] ligase n=1 Tax=Microaceticoccus formicicus TaxID=3118105 RepID=UPI003CD04E07|nr:biotin--[acetyl-CoA-carboxylase] ligase [Peptoniphilaceae bacterium AMB_02]